MAYYDSFRAARWIRLINLILQAVLFLTLFAGLNYVALNHAWRFDLTQTHRLSLSPETRSYLEGLTRNNRKGKIELRYLDVYQNRREAEELELDQPNQVILLSENRRRVMTLADFYETKEMRRAAFRGEVALTASLLDVSNPNKKKIYFLAGHGEMRPEDVDRRRGLSGLRDELQQRNFEVAALDLNLSHKVPDDAALVVVASPQGRLQPFEEELLRNFLTTRAGRLILMFDPGVQTGLESLLFDWGVIVFDNVII